MPEGSSKNEFFTEGCLFLNLKHMLKITEGTETPEVCWDPQGEALPGECSFKGGFAHRLESWVCKSSHLALGHSQECRRCS
jgi:hypothetical protein